MNKWKASHPHDPCLMEGNLHTGEVRTNAHRDGLPKNIKIPWVDLSSWHVQHLSMTVPPKWGPNGAGAMSSGQRAGWSPLSGTEDAVQLGPWLERNTCRSAHSYPQFSICRLRGEKIKHVSKELIDKLIFFSQSLIFKSVSLYSRPSQQKSWAPVYAESSWWTSTSSNVFQQLRTTRSSPGTELRLEPRRLLELQAIQIQLCRISNLKYHPNNPIHEAKRLPTAPCFQNFISFFLNLILRLHFFRFSLSRIFPLLVHVVRCLSKRWKQTVLIRWGSARCRSVENMKP